MATPAGLEPVTSAVTGRRSNQLSYGAICTSMKHKRIYYSITGPRAPPGASRHAMSGPSITPPSHSDARHSSPSDTMVGGGLAWIRSLCGQGGTGLTRRTAIRDSGGRAPRCTQRIHHKLKTKETAEFQPLFKE